MEEMEFEGPQFIDLQTSMTLGDLEKTCGDIIHDDAHKVEVHWVGVDRWQGKLSEPTMIDNENCSKVLTLLKQRGGIDQLAVYYISDHSGEDEKVKRGNAERLHAMACSTGQI